MATARIDQRPQRALAIVVSGDIHESRPGLWRVRDRAGSGQWHYVTATTCDCRDYQRTGLACKHQLALNTYLKQTPVDELPGDFLDTDLNFDDVSLTETAPRGAWYKGTYYTAEQCAQAAEARVAAGLVCPTCGGTTRTERFYCGGVYRWFRCCVRQPEHRATQL